MRGQVLAVNRKGARALGMAPSELTAQGSGLLRPKDPDKLRMLIQDILKSSTASQAIDLPAGRFEAAVSMVSEPGKPEYEILLILKGADDVR